MTAIEVVLILIGIAAIAVSYFISEKASEERLREAARQLVLGEDSKTALENQTRETVRNILEDMTEDIAGRAERELEKLSNEKIMSVHDYSDTVLEEINKSHNEVMFLYSMLDGKDKELKDTVREVQNMVKTVKRLKEETEVSEETLTDKARFVSEEIQPEELQMLLDSESEDVTNNNERILKLYREGRTVLEIAKELGLGTGEVKLVIDLFRE